MCWLVQPREDRRVCRRLQRRDPSLERQSAWARDLEPVSVRGQLTHIAGKHAVGLVSVTKSSSSRERLTEHQPLAVGAGDPRLADELGWRTPRQGSEGPPPGGQSPTEIAMIFTSLTFEAGSPL